MGSETASIAAYHGWGFDRTCWQSWAAWCELQGIPFHTADRGYFGDAIDCPASPIVFVHSYGLHLCPLTHLQQAKLLVIFSSFHSFHPAKEPAKRRSQQMLQQMLIQFENAPGLVLDNFKTKCGILYQPPDSPRPDSLKLDLLSQDLKDLGECSLNPERLSQVPQILIFHGLSDRIVSPQKGKELAEQLPHSRYIAIAEAGHALPFTHHDPCRLILQQSGL